MFLAGCDAVAIVTPDYFANRKLVEFFDGEVVPIPMDYFNAADCAGIDMNQLEAAFKAGVKLFLFSNPNNPTGILIPPNALKAFIAEVSPKATVLVDEAYNELTDRPDDNSTIDLVKAGADVIVCRTFSKIYGMAGLRVGYAIASEENAARIRSHQMSFGGNLGGLAAAIASYNDTPFLDQSRAAVLEARAMIIDAVANSGLSALPSQTNFVFVKVPDANALRDAMAQSGIAIRGAYGNLNGYSRVSTGKLEDVARYAAALPKLSRQLWG